jgi:hypothetical protein
LNSVNQILQIKKPPARAVAFLKNCIIPARVARVESHVALDCRTAFYDLDAFSSSEQAGLRSGLATGSWPRSVPVDP